MSAFIIFDIRLMDRATGKAFSSAGGNVFVALAGAYNKATLYNPAADYAALANPIAFNYGRALFAVASGSVGQASQPSVDIYGMGPGGRCFVARGCKPGDPTEIWLDSDKRNQVLTLPFSIADTTATTETDTGFDIPVGARLVPFPSINVKAIDATETVDVGLLSSESGGDANGIIAAASVGTLGSVAVTLNGTPTLGALLNAVALATTTPVPQEKVVSTAVSVTYTLTAGSDTAAGLLEVPFMLPG